MMKHSRSKAMSLLIRRTALTFALLGVLVPALPVRAGSDATRPTRFGLQRQSIEGSWRVSITPRICQTGQALRTPFPAMATFAMGGTLITSDSGFSPALRGAGHGAWHRLEGGSFSAVTEAFLFNAEGALTGTQRIRQTIELVEPDLFRASVNAQMMDLEGKVYMNGCATSEGVRIK